MKSVYILFTENNTKTWIDIYIYIVIKVIK